MFNIHEHVFDVNSLFEQIFENLCLICSNIYAILFTVNTNKEAKMQKKPLTEAQNKVYDYLKQVLLERGYPPSVREIGTACNLSSTSTVFSHLERLEAKGYIRRDPSKPRAIEICDESFQRIRNEVVSLPVVGQVAAGQPILAEQNIENYFPIPTEYVPRGEAFILKVKGNSMVNIGIMNGDSVLVESTKDVRNGDVVVALIEDSATVKTFYKEGDHIRLQPENDEMEPIIVPTCTILGKVFGVYRFFK